MMSVIDTREKRVHYTDVVIVPPPIPKKTKSLDRTSDNNALVQQFSQDTVLQVNPYELKSPPLSSRPLTPQAIRKHKIVFDNLERSRSLTQSHARQIQRPTHAHPLSDRTSPPAEEDAHLRHRPLPQLPPSPCATSALSTTSSATTDYAIIQNQPVKSVVPIDDGDDYVDVSNIKGPQSPPNNTGSTSTSPSHSLPPSSPPTIFLAHSQPLEDDYIEMKGSPLPTTPVAKIKSRIKSSGSADDALFAVEPSEDYVEMFSSSSAKASPSHTPLPSSPKTPLRPKSEFRGLSPEKSLPVKRAVSCDLLELNEDNDDTIDYYIDMMNGRHKMATPTPLSLPDDATSIYEPIDFNRPIPPPRRRRKAKKLQEQSSMPAMSSSTLPASKLENTIRKSHSVSTVSSHKLSANDTRCNTMFSKPSTITSPPESPAGTTSSSNKGTIRTGTQKLVNKLRLLKVN